MAAWTAADPGVDSRSGSRWATAFVVLGALLALAFGGVVGTRILPAVLVPSSSIAAPPPKVDVPRGSESASARVASPALVPEIRTSPDQLPNAAPVKVGKEPSARGARQAPGATPRTRTAPKASKPEGTKSTSEIPKATEATTALAAASEGPGQTSEGFSVTPSSLSEALR
jgi:hypothetical protein